MKKLVSVFLVILMALSAVPVFAESLSEEVLIKVKTKVEIPSELTEFSYGENAYDNVLRYGFNWHDEEYTKEINVYADSLGRIVSYNYYEQMDYNGERSLIGYTKSDALTLSDEFVSRAYDEFSTGDDRLIRDEKKDRSTYSGRYKTFSFTYQRTYKGESVNSNYVTIKVRATKEKIYVQSAYASLDNEFKVESLSAKENITQAEYLKAFPIDFYYVPTYTEKGKEVKLVYTSEKGYVSRVTGEKVTEAFFDRYADREESVTMDSNMAFGSANKESGLTKVEKEEIEKMNNLVKPEEVLKKLKAFEILKITDDMKIVNSSTYKTDEKYIVNFELSDEKREMNVSYNGETGVVTMLYSYQKTDGETPSKEEPKEEIEAFAKAMSNGKTEETEIEFNSYNETELTMEAWRIVNGVKYPANNVTVEYNKIQECVTGYYLSWDEDVSALQNPKDAIGLEKAEKVIFGITPLYNTYVKTDEGYVPSATVDRPLTIDAVTGEDWYPQAESKIQYTDISSHWAEKEIQTLFEHDIYLPGENFNPDGRITQADMIRLLSACRDSHVIPITWLKEQVVEEAINQGYIETNEPDKEMTRLEAFEALVNIIGYGEVASFDIYKTSFSDLEANGSAEILKALGVLKGDAARAEDYATRAEIAVMVYRYLSR